MGNQFIFIHSLIGRSGADALVGVDERTLTSGQGAINILQGGNDADTFVLGNANPVFYDDGNGTRAGLEDYAMIQDFKAEEGDRIQLHGSTNNYRIGTSSLGRNHQAIYHQHPGVDFALFL